MHVHSGTDFGNVVIFLKMTDARKRMAMEEDGHVNNNPNLRVMASHGRTVLLMNEDTGEFRVVNEHPSLGTLSFKLDPVIIKYITFYCIHAWEKEYDEGKFSWFVTVGLLEDIGEWPENTTTCVHWWSGKVIGSIECDLRETHIIPMKGFPTFAAAGIQCFWFVMNTSPNEVIRIQFMDRETGAILDHCVSKILMPGKITSMGAFNEPHLPVCVDSREHQIPYEVVQSHGLFVACYEKKKRVVAFVSWYSSHEDVHPYMTWEIGNEEFNNDLASRRPTVATRSSSNSVVQLEKMLDKIDLSWWPFQSIMYNDKNSEILLCDGNHIYRVKLLYDLGITQVRKIKCDGRFKFNGQTSFIEDGFLWSAEMSDSMEKTIYVNDIEGGVGFPTDLGKISQQEALIDAGKVYNYPQGETTVIEFGKRDGYTDER